MRTRSSRLFVVLLHLLGVSNHFQHHPNPHYEWSTTGANGIVGVHPYSIVLERLDLQAVGGLDEVEWLQPKKQQPSHMKHVHQPFDQTSRQKQTESKERIGESDEIGNSMKVEGEKQQQEQLEPFWLQDSSDGKCLGPSGGFSECGDATLWFIQRKERKRKAFKMGPFGVEEFARNEDEPYGYAFQLVDMDYEKGSSQDGESSQHSSIMSWLLNRGKHSNNRRQFTVEKDCLVPLKSRKDPAGKLSLATCHARNRAWSWRVDQNGRLYEINDKKPDERHCLWRANDGESVLSDCAEGFLDEESLEPGRLVQFTLVRYRAKTVPPAPVLGTLETQAGASDRLSVKKTINFKEVQEKTERKEEVKTEPLKSKESLDVSKLHSKTKGENDKQVDKEHLPKRDIDIAHSHASNPMIHGALKLGSRPVLTGQEKKAEKNKSSARPFALTALKDTNPILFIGGSEPEDEGRMSVGDRKPKRNRKNMPSKHKMSSSDSEASYKLRRIEIHPYIAASKDETWVDPKTGLQFRTDLCRYLGHDRKESGRHTLVGVGQYIKTMMKIKVYGVALYVSKRDVLADPMFEKFASNTAEELRTKPDFYKHLRNNHAISKFDRTILLKLNMQLSTETMRGSLGADWKLLTDESKDLLINSSMRPRPANEAMLEKIKSPDNPSRCSCSQIAPEEYDADPSCCARGTELVFTWRKNGDLEVRLDGRVMDTFPRPDIAQGIFYEYLRTDDPISSDFIERVVDGFPFLLGPLAQVKGITSHLSSKQHQNDDAFNDGASKSSITVGAAFKNHWDGLAANLGGVAAFLQHSATGLTENTVSTFKSIGDNARNFGEEIERRRDLLWTHLTLLPQNLLTQRERYALVILDVGDSVIEEEAQKAPGRKHRAPRGRVFNYPLRKWLGEDYQAPDEIGPMYMQPTTNTPRKVFLALVHLYLLLLLVVSFPGSHQTRTKLVYRRSSSDKSSSSSILSSTLDDSFSEDDSERSLLFLSDEENDGRGSMQTNEKCVVVESDGISRDWSNNLKSNSTKRERRVLRFADKIDQQEQQLMPKSDMKKSLSYFL